MNFKTFTLNGLYKYVLPLLLMIGILIAWDFTKPRRSPMPQHPTLSQAPAPPHNPNEEIFKQHRTVLRASTQRALDRSWSRYCEEDERRKLASAITEYLTHRRQQEASYPKRWGDAGGEYIRAAWSTSDDLRIERLIRESWERGHVALKDFRPYMREWLAPIIAGADTREKPCT